MAYSAENIIRLMLKRCVLNSNQWLKAYQSFQKHNPIYHAPYLGLQDLWQQLQTNLRILVSLAQSLGKFTYLLARVYLSIQTFNVLGFDMWILNLIEAYVVSMLASPWLSALFILAQIGFYFNSIKNYTDNKDYIHMGNNRFSF